MSESGLGVIFDCDGTLLDSMQRWHEVDYDLAERGGAEVTKADRDFMTQGTLEESADYIHEHFGIGKDGQDVMKMIMDDMFAYYDNEAVMKPGAMELIQGLYELGIPMGVASSTPAKLLKAGLEHVGAAKYMKTILSVEDVNSSKREPVIFDAVRESLGTDKCSTWGVDDALYAINTLTSAGYPALAIYDSDIAGAPSELKNAATAFIPSFEGFTAQKFLELSKTL